MQEYRNDKLIRKKMYDEDGKLIKEQITP
jgi:hypothetical protein